MVLVIVLWIVTLLAVMAGSFAYSMRIETRLATSAVERAQARALAEAGIAYAQAWQLDFESSRKLWPPNGDPHEWTFGGGRLRIEVTNAHGLISLNSAGDDALKALFAGIGLNGSEQDRLLEKIRERRQPNQLSLSGTVTGLEPQSGQFDSVEELQRIEGITPAIYRRVADKITTFSNHFGVNPELASADMLRALGLDERTVADYITARAAAAEGPPPAPPQPAGGGAVFSGGRGNVYHMAAVAETAAGTAVVVRVVTDLRIGMGSAQGIRVLAWREGR
ncbi:MAG: general secretion pathway protein GspK [Candidatus Competibacter sp.]|nr:general secretion pathway protein GspK [Candidatus Competibacter sp.]